MLIATSPRLSSDQERKKSAEEAYPVEVDCMSSKCDSDIFCGKRGDTETYEEHSRNIPYSQSTDERMTDRITTKQPEELSDYQQTINAQSPFYHNYVKPTIMQSEIQHHTKQPTESQGEEFIYYIQHAEAPSEELDSFLQTAVPTNDLCNLLQAATVESEESTLKTLIVGSEELHGSTEMPTVQSELGNPPQISTAQSDHLTNHLQIPTVISDKFCNTLQTASLESEEPFKSSHTVTVQSEEPFTSSYASTVQSEEPLKSLKTALVQSEDTLKSLKTAAVQSEEFCSVIQMPAVLSEKPLDCLQTKTIHLVEPCYSLWTTTDQSEELNRPLQTSTIQSERLGDLLITASIQPLDLYHSKEAQTTQVRDRLEQSALDDLYRTGQAIPNHSKVQYQSMQATTVQAKCHHTMKATEDKVDSTVNSGQRSSTQSAQPYYVKQTSTVQSEEIYLSRTCDSHWSDSVTANKVAVEGDLNG